MTLYRLDPKSSVAYRIDPANQTGPTVRIVHATDPAWWGIVPRTMLHPISDARTTDPDTAHAAASLQTENVKRASHRLVLSLLATHGPLTDHELAIHASSALARRVGHDSIGKRRLEVQRLGYVERTSEKRPTETGAEAIVWAITTAGRRELANWTVAA